MKQEIEKNEFKSFNLSDNILKAINNLGYINPSEVQKEVIPKILKRKDLIVKSQTGSGKTASYGIPLAELTDVSESFIQALILVPTRELALQVKDEISNIGMLNKVRCSAIFGKQPIKDQIRELKQRVHIVCGTPGRVIDHIKRGSFDFSKLKYLIIDEADKMLQMGFIDQMEEILESLKEDRKVALFSATLPKEIESLCNKYMNDYEVLNIQSKVFNRDRIEEGILKVESKDKFKYLYKNIYAENPNKAIVFCNTKDKVKDVFNELKREGFLVGELHGDMDQKERISAMERFKNDEFKILIATDIAARGIHVDNITHVFNYEIPMERESYVHRIGRTGRAGKEGKAISFVSKYEEKFLAGIEEYIGYSIKVMDHPSDEEITLGKIKFKESQKEFKDNIKTKVNKTVHLDVTKVYLSGGKKKKLRANDIVGAFSNIKGLTYEDIGIIDIGDTCSYVDILNKKGNKILKENKEITIKGKKIRMQRARN